MKVRISNSSLKGSIVVPVSKSYAHRYLLAAALTGKSEYEKAKLLLCVNPGDDIIATVNCIDNIIFSDSEAYAFDSGTTLRLIIPIAAALGKEATVKLGEQLRLRPIKPLIDTLIAGGVDVSFDGERIKTKGKLKAGKYVIDPSLSSQFVSGMLFALSIIDGKSELILSAPLKSAPYVDMTLKVLELAGIKVRVNDNYYLVEGKGGLSFNEFNPEGDWSSGSVLHVLKSFGNEIEIGNLDEKSIQGDKEIVSITRTMKESSEEVIDVDISNIPDLAPAIALAACKLKSVRMHGARRLEIKESNRAEAILEIINSAGGKAYLNDDILTVLKTDNMTGGICNCRNDHRMVMLAAGLSNICRDDIVISSAECIKKSYPDFFNDFRMLGGIIKIEE